jgi:2-haloacid dehalogenase
MERGEITRDRVLIERFELLFPRIGADADPYEFERTYQALLGQHAFLVEGAVDILAYLRPKYRLFIVSNGVAATLRKLSIFDLLQTHPLTPLH